jgi:hypothetical protein
MRRKAPRHEGDRRQGAQVSGVARTFLGCFVRWVTVVMVGTRLLVLEEDQGAHVSEGVARVLCEADYALGGDRVLRFPGVSRAWGGMEIAPGGEAAQVSQARAQGKLPVSLEGEQPTWEGTQDAARMVAGIAYLSGRGSVFGCQKAEGSRG